MKKGKKTKGDERQTDLSANVILIAYILVGKT